MDAQLCDHFFFEKDEKTMLSKKRLLASYWSIAGDTYPVLTTEVSPFDFRQQVEIAAAAGFQGLGLAHQDLLALRDRLGYQQVRSIMAANGIKDLEVETLRHWSASGDRGRASEAMRHDLLVAAEELGARHIKVSGDTSGAEQPTHVLAEFFREALRGRGADRIKSWHRDHAVVQFRNYHSHHGNGQRRCGAQWGRAA